MDSANSPTSTSVEGDGDGRKRVCKACERCRVKKSKCDGKKPCSRCRHDDAICAFGGRKKRVDRVHPKGYVEILERQQKQLVKGIRAMYDRQLQGTSWNGPRSSETYPPTHEILGFLGALEGDDSSDEDDMDDAPPFEENVAQLRQVAKEKEASQPTAAKVQLRKQSASTNSVRQRAARRDSAKSSEHSSVLSPESLATPSMSPKSQYSQLPQVQSMDVDTLSADDWSRSLGDAQLFAPSKFTFGDSDLGLVYDPLNAKDFAVQSGFEDAYLAPPPWETGEEIATFG